jgi:hypothetical protein
MFSWLHRNKNGLQNMANRYYLYHPAVVYQAIRTQQMSCDANVIAQVGRLDGYEEPCGKYNV